MELKDWIIKEWLPGITNEQSSVVNRQSSIVNLAEAVPSMYPYVETDVQGRIWKKLTEDEGKDLSPLTHDRMLEIAYWLYDTNPMAHWLLGITKDYIIGDGISYDSSYERIKEILDRFWDDPVNHWDLKQHQKALELGLYGEQIYPVFINETTGHVRLGYIDPYKVKEVVHDPENSEIAIGVILKGKGGRKGKAYKIILRGQGEEILTKSTVRLREEYQDGECFFFAINKVSNASRGRSDLLSLADWLDAYDQFLFNRVERAGLMNNFLWDIALEGLNEDQIREYAKSVSAPKAGSMRFHNEKVKWDAIVPDMKAIDASEDARLFRNHILGGKGLPEHWYGGGGEVNRATSIEMGAPTFKMLKARQGYFRCMIECIFDFVLNQAVIHKELTEVEQAGGYSIIMPPIDTKDWQKIASAFFQISQAVAMAISQGILSKETGIKLLAIAAGELGIEINPQEELQRIVTEAEGLVLQDYKDQGKLAEAIKKFRVVK